MKRKLKKLLSVITIFTVVFTSTFLPSNVTKVEALASNVSGQQILNTAMSYGNDGRYNYNNVGSCTGLVTRTLNKLGIAHSIVGTHPYDINSPQASGGSRYTPDQMYQNAVNNPSDAKLIWSGLISELNSSIIANFKNGDLVIQRANDVKPYTGFGHVAFIHKDGGAVSMYGANSTVTGIGHLQIYPRLTRGSGPVVDTYSRITVFRLVDDVQPKYATTSATKTATETVNVNLTKTDVENGKPLSDVKFDFYRDDVKFASDVVTNENGIASATFTKSYTATSKTYKYCTNYDQLSAEKKEEVVNAGISKNKVEAQAKADAEAQANANAQANKKHVFKAVETETKKEYWLDPNNDTVTGEITGSGNVNLELGNQHQTGSVTITKFDKQTNNPLDEAIYGVYAKEDIIHPDGKTGVVYKADQLVQQFAPTGANGKSTITGLYLGKYYVKEITAAPNYVVDKDTYDFTLTYKGQHFEITDGADLSVYNLSQRGTIKLDKKDKEIDNGTVTGGDVNDLAQGEATVKGAVYGLYAKRDIVHPDGASGIIRYNQTADDMNEIRLTKGTDLEVKNVKATAGTLLATAKTDAKGEIKFENLYLGNYYLQEITSSDGYLVDEEKHEVNLDYAGQDVEITNKTAKSLEQVKKQAFQIIKVSSDGESNNNVDTLAGAEFTYILKEYVDEHGSFDKALKEIKAGNTTIKSSEWGTMVTDKKGYAISKELPYGTYIVSETVVPDEHFKADDFTVTVSEDDRDPQTWRIINDKEYESLIKIVKKDAETGKIVLLPNTTFKIYNVDKKEYVSFLELSPLPHVVDEFKTDKSGMVYLPKPLKVGNYRLEEIKAPYGYLVNDETIEFRVTDDNITQVGPDGKTPLLTLEVENTSVKGGIGVQKVGEQLTGIEEDEDGNLQFIYEKLPVENAKFVVEANEDIYSADNQKDLIYSKGDVVAELTTSTTGFAATDPLPLGKYKIYETTAGDGFVLNKEVKEVELTYKDQNTSVVFEDVDYESKRQKVEVDVSKKDAETDTLLAGAKFGLYTKEDIYVSNSAPTETRSTHLLVPANTLLETVVTDDNGKAVFNADLPIGFTFEIRELEAPIGYASTDKVFTIDTAYQGQDTETLTFSPIFKNEITKVEVSKTDITTGEELAGNHLTVFEKGNEAAVFDTWVSTGTPHMIKGLEVGKTYVLRETSSAFGFAIAKDIEFTIADTGEVQKVKMENKLVKGKLAWNKTGEIFTYTDFGSTEYGVVNTPVWEKSNLLGAEITIYAAEDITLGNGITYYKKGEVIETLESDWETVYSKELPVGRYYYMETKTPTGRVPDTEKHYFEIEDNQKDELQVIENELVNHMPTYEINFTKYLEKNDVDGFENAYGDVVFGIYALDDTYNYMGSVAIKSDTLIATTGIDADGHLVNIPKLPVGNYYLKELNTNSAYEFDVEAKYYFSIEESNEEVVTVNVSESKVENKLKDFSIMVNKVDAQTKKNIVSKDFEFTRYADEKCTVVIDKAVADETNGTALFDDVHYGVTYIKETKAPIGYRLSNEVVKVEVNDNGVYVNDKKVEAKDEIYSFVYQNSLLPTINTGDDTNKTTWIMLLVTSSSLLGALAMLKRKKKEN